MAFEIRLCRPQDSAGVVRAVKAVYDEYRFSWDPDDYHADLYDLESAFAPPCAWLWVAEEQSEILGCGGLAVFEKVPGEPDTVVELDGYRRLAGTDCELLRLYVHPEARRKGVGSTIFQEVLRQAEELGREAMEIWSDKRFVDAHRLYERAGAHVVGDRICDDPDESPEWGLVLPLGARR